MSSAPASEITGSRSASTTPPANLCELEERVAELLAENNRLREAVAARDALIAVAGHELRNPMTPLLGRVQLLRRMVSGEFSRETAIRHVRQIEQVIEQFVKRATTLLDVTRLTTGKMELQRTPIDLREVILESAAAFQQVARHASCELTTQLPIGEDLTVVGDRLAIEEILENLISNAIKYGGGSPVVISAKVEDPQGIAEVGVEDGGPGISVEDQARIFERFERAVRPDERRSGFGVGLWIVRQFAEAMNGEIRVTSLAGQGSIFTVTLPLHR